MQMITNLSLSHNYIKALGAFSICLMSKITTLNLSYNDAQNAGVDHISHLQRLHQ